MKKRQQIFDAQKKLEEQLRKEEDELYRTFKANRKEEAKKLSAEIDQEWETRLQELTEKFDREFEKKNNRKLDKKVCTYDSVFHDNRPAIHAAVLSSKA